MKNTCVLQFSSLADVALFLKTIPLEAYIVNTVRLTITAPFTPLEYAVAKENFRAREVKPVLVGSNDQK